jgi:uncharacterized protein
MKHLIVSLHDFHPKSLTAIRGQIEFLTSLGVQNYSILVIPQYHHKKRLQDDAPSLAYLNERHAANDDLVAHGYYHDRVGQGKGSIFWTKLYTANESEFHSISDGEVRHRLTRAQTLWAENGWQLHGFIAPAWLMPEEQDVILKRMNFTYTTRLKYFQNLRTLKKTETQSLCYSTRAQWRRNVSLRWNKWLFDRLLKTKDVIRLSLHPGDLQFEPIKLQIQSIVESALANGYQPITYAQFAKL